MNASKFDTHIGDPSQEAQSFRARGSLLHIAIAVTLILSIAVILTVAGATEALAQARSDVMMIEDSSKFSTALVLGGILAVMAVLTVMALRDVAPAQHKRPIQARRNNSRRQA